MAACRPHPRATRRRSSSGLCARRASGPVDRAGGRARRAGAGCLVLSGGGMIRGGSPSVSTCGSPRHRPRCCRPAPFYGIGHGGQAMAGSPTASSPVPAAPLGQNAWWLLRPHPPSPGRTATTPPRPDGPPHRRPRTPRRERPTGAVHRCRHNVPHHHPAAPEPPRESGAARQGPRRPWVPRRRHGERGTGNDATGVAVTVLPGPASSVPWRRRMPGGGGRWDTPCGSVPGRRRRAAASRASRSARGSGGPARPPWP